MGHPHRQPQDHCPCRNPPRDLCRSLAGAPLAESDEILTAPATISTAFDEERRRVDARVKRLTRSRNAAIHGGTLSKEACATITDLAPVLAQDALNTSIWARVTGRPPEAYATSRADEHRQRIANLKNGGDLTNLFTLTP